MSQVETLCIRSKVQCALNGELMGNVEVFEEHRPILKTPEFISNHRELARIANIDVSLTTKNF